MEAVTYHTQNLACRGARVDTVEWKTSGADLTQTDLTLKMCEMHSHFFLYR